MRRLRRVGAFNNRGSTETLARGLLVCVCLIGTWSVEAFGQQDPLLEDWRWVHYGIESGLPSEAVKDLAESQETLWAATTAGMAWFDGYRWNAVGVTGLDPRLFTDMAPDRRDGVYVAADGSLYHVDQTGSEAVPLSFDGVRIDVSGLATTGRQELYLTQGPDVYRLIGDSLERLPRPPSSSTNRGDLVAYLQFAHSLAVFGRWCMARK
jgi:hypothetical protein